MAINRRGSRRIVVDATPYRWIIRRKPTYTQANAWTPLTFAVELEAGHGSVLVVALDSPRMDNWFREPGAVVTPQLVAHAIREAIASGWSPKAKGRPHTLRVQPNPPVNADARDVPANASDRAARAGYRER